jgi:hypothetical protein
MNETDKEGSRPVSDVTTAVEPLTCVPEWCDEAGAGHSGTCPEHLLDITKSAFVAAAEQGALAAVETYRMLRDEEGMTHEAALEMTQVEAQEGAVCFAGIGSCGRGWCNH